MSPTPPTEPSESAPRYRTPSVVMIVDDTLAQRYALTRTMESAGFRVLQAASGTEALRVAQTQADAMLLDINLPDVNGYEVARRLRANPETAALPIVHISAVDTTDAHRAMSLASGADDYLTHPLAGSALVARLDELLRARKA